MEIFMLNIESRKLMRYSSKVSVFSKNSEFDLMILNTEASTQFSTSVLPSSCSIDAHKNVRMSGFFPPDEGGNSSTYEWPGSLGAKKHDGETLVLDVPALKGMSGSPVQDKDGNFIGILKGKDGAISYAQNISAGNRAHVWLREQLSRWKSCNRFGDNDMSNRFGDNDMSNRFGDNDMNRIQPKSLRSDKGFKKEKSSRTSQVVSGLIETGIEAATAIENTVPPFVKADMSKRLLKRKKVPGLRR